MFSSRHVLGCAFGRRTALRGLSASHLMGERPPNKPVSSYFLPILYRRDGSKRSLRRGLAITILGLSIYCTVSSLAARLAHNIARINSLVLLLNIRRLDYEYSTKDLTDQEVLVQYFAALWGSLMDFAHGQRHDFRKFYTAAVQIDPDSSKVIGQISQSAYRRIHGVLEKRQRCSQEYLAVQEMLPIMVEVDSQVKAWLRRVESVLERKRRELSESKKPATVTKATDESDTDVPVIVVG